MTDDTDASPMGLGASLEVMLGKAVDVLDRMDRREQRMQQLWQDVHPVPILSGQVPLTAGAGTMNVPDRLGPKDGYWWDVRRLSAWGFTAGSVTVFLNDATGLGEQLATYSQPGQWTWGGQLFMGPRDFLVVTATGITGTVSFAGQGIEVADRMLPEYLL
jgi:hypothetical protein